MAVRKNTPIHSDVRYRRFNVRDELKAACEDGFSCERCQHGSLLYIAASNLLDSIEASERKERRIRRAQRKGNLIVFPRGLQV
jgi:hypothetical protein